MKLVSREIAQPNKNTFTIKPIKRFIQKYKKGIVLDPFPYPYNHDALKYLDCYPENYADLILFDPPYSQRQLKEVYEGKGISFDMNAGYWSKLGKAVYRVLKPGGICLKFGWNSCRISKGMEIIDGMIVCHGGMHNDTIITAQKKINFTFEG